MDQNDPRLNSQRGPEGPAEGGRIRRPTRTGRASEARLERVSAYLDGWTTDRERAAVERELADDPEAREDLADLRLVRIALATLEMPRAPRSFALLAPPERRPVRLFRRMEWATRGAAGVAALAFAFALVNGPQVSETVTSAAPSASQEQAAGPVQDAAVPSGTTAKARETATQTLDLATGGRAASPQADTAPAGTTPPAPAPAPAAVPSATSTPVVAGTFAATATPTPTPEPRALLAPTPTATPTAAPAGATTTPAPTVEATRFTAPAPTVEPSPAPAAPAVAPKRADTPAPQGADSAAAPATSATTFTPPSAPAPGTLPPPVASEDTDAMSVVPALGVLALLLGLLVIIERVGIRRTQA